MRKFLTSIAVLGAVVAAVPASAQTYGGGYSNGYGNTYGQGYRGDGYNQRGSQLWQLRAAVDRAIRDGRLSRREAMYFRREVAELQRLDQRARYGNSGWERRVLEQRTRALIARLHDLRGNRGYGNRGNDREDNDGERYDRNGDGRYDRHDR
jgi:hypothetical protein